MNYDIELDRIDTTDDMITRMRALVESLEKVQRVLYDIDETVAMRVYDVTSANIDSGVTTTPASIVFYTTKNFDTHDSYDAITGKYTVPITGIYRMSAAIRWAGLDEIDNTNLYLGLKTDNPAWVASSAGWIRVVQYEGVTMTGADQTRSSTVDDVFSFNKGDKVWVQAYQLTGDDNEGFHAADYYNTFSVVKIK